MKKYIIQIEDGDYIKMWYDYDEYDNLDEAINWLQKIRQIRKEMKSKAKFQLIEREEIIQEKVLPY